MVRLTTITLFDTGGSGPNPKRNTGRTNDTSCHILTDLSPRKGNYSRTIPSPPHVPLENPTPLTSYDEAAYGKRSSSNKTLGDHDTKPDGTCSPPIHTVVYFGKKSPPTG